MSLCNELENKLMINPDQKALYRSAQADNIKFYINEMISKLCRHRIGRVE